MNLLQIQGAEKQFGEKRLLIDASLSVNAGEHIGFVGPNGAGKTTLFKVLTGLSELDSGQIIKSQALQAGYLEQESEWTLDVGVTDFLMASAQKPLWQLQDLGRSLGLSEAHFATSLRELSGGYRMRVRLLELIGQEPNLLLLDEPTNFLDLESLLALEKFLQNHEGAFILISHDREFLRRTTEFTLELESGELTKFPGHIDDYFEQKEQLKEMLLARQENQANKRRQIEDFVTRFGAKASKAKQAQSKLKQLQRMEVIQIKRLPVKAKIQIPSPVTTGKESLHLTEATLGYAERPILQNVNLRLVRGNHLGVVGFNGAGKSTLLKSLAGRLPLLAGKRELGHNVELSYFAQHVTDDLDLSASVWQEFQSAADPQVPQQDILDLAASLLFTGDKLQQPIRSLSGGEKSRVALGQILLRKSPLLILDEPTNHLDFDTVEALTVALEDFPGTVVAVSHDRSFLRRIATQVLEIRDGQAQIYPGTYDEYVWSLEKGALRDRNSSQPVERTASSHAVGRQTPASKFNFKEESKRLASEIREAEKGIRENEKKVLQWTEERQQVNDQLISAQGVAAQALAKDLKNLSVQIDQAEEQMLSQMELLEKLQTELQLLKGSSN